MTDKPPFDPNAGFTTAPPTGGKPAFNPGAAFSTGAPSSPWDMLSGRSPGQIEPDVGEPAIGNGGEFSPGVPAVNEEVDRIAQSANKNLIEPIKHPIDTLTGVGRVGLGAAQYAGFPGEEYKPYAAALAKDYADTYGSLPGFKNALINDPVRVGLDASMGLGALRGLGRRAGVIDRPAPRTEAPTTEQLFDSAEGHYNAMHGYGVELHPQVLEGTATNIATELKSAGYRDYLAPKTFRAVDELRNPDGPTMTTQEVEGVRRALNKAAADPAERDAARRAIAEIDNTMAALTPADAAVNGHFAPVVSEAAKAARGDYAAAKRAEQLEGATTKAELQAASTGSGANIDNATRQQIRAILNSPKKSRGFTDAERAQMEQIVRGTFTGNAARLMGKLAPSGIVSGALSAGIGHAAGHTLGVPGLGLAAKAIGDSATKRAAARLSEQVRLRSPLARATGARAAPGPNVSRGLRAAVQTGRISNPYGEQ